MMLDHLGETQAAADLLGAIEAVTGEARVLTPDLGGEAGTSAFTDRVLAELRG